MLLTSRNDDIIQNNSPTNKQIMQDLFFEKKILVQICTQWITCVIIIPGRFFPSGKEHPPTSVVGDIYIYIGREDGVKIKYYPRGYRKLQISPLGYLDESNKDKDIYDAVT